jgi:SAM-dependent methyltransferase
MSDSGVAQYEEIQEFNRLVSWLHSLRYRNILGIFKKISQENGEKPVTIIDIGCGYANLFSVLEGKFQINYTGIEIHPPFVEAARSRYSRHQNFKIINDDALHALPLLGKADAVVALESLEHMPEHDVVRLVEAVAEIGPKYFICSVPVEIGPSIWLKNLGSWAAGYVRHKEYSWPDTLWAGLYQLDKLAPHNCGHCGFDWRWLAQTIRHNMKITESRTLPFGVPAALAFSRFFVAVPRKRVLPVRPVEPSPQQAQTCQG